MRLFTRQNHTSIGDILFNSAIIGIFAAVALLPESVPSYLDLYIAFKAGLFAFLAQVIYEKGIKKKKPND